MKVWLVVLAVLGGCHRVFELRHIDETKDATGEDATGGLRRTRTITIAPSTSELLADFPVSIVLGGDTDLATHARADGRDIGFFDVGGQPLAAEIVRYDAGSLEAWVRVSLAGLTEIRMAYGGGETETMPELTWANSVVAAWHLDRSSRGTTWYA